MIRPVEGRGFVAPEPARAAEEAPAAAREGGGTFAETLVRLRETERQTDRWLERAMRRGIGDPQELLRLQVVVQRFQIQIELASRLADQVTQAVRTLTRPT